MSLIYIAAARSRFPAWLALLAISLLFIAPVISKSLMARHGHSSAMMMPAHSMMMSPPTAAIEDRHSHAAGKHSQRATEESGHAHTVAHHSHLAAKSAAHLFPATSHHRHLASMQAEEKSAALARSSHSPNAVHLKHHHMSLMDDSACGYCVLLIHLALDSVQLPRLWTLLQAATPAVPFQLPALIICWIPVWFRPRGPPVNAFYPA